MDELLRARRRYSSVQPYAYKALQPTPTVGTPASAAALIERPDQKAGRIEAPPIATHIAAAWPAMQMQRRLATRIAGGFPVDGAAIKHRQLTAGEWLDRRKHSPQGTRQLLKGGLAGLASTVRCNPPRSDA